MHKESADSYKQTYTATAAEDAEDAIDNPSARETASMFLRDFPTEVVKNLKPASREN
jgi:hypothetical protein